MGSPTRATGFEHPFNSTCAPLIVTLAPAWTVTVVSPAIWMPPAVSPIDPCVE